MSKVSGTQEVLDKEQPYPALARALLPRNQAQGADLELPTSLRPPPPRLRLQPATDAAVDRMAMRPGPK